MILRVSASVGAGKRLAAPCVAPVAEAVVVVPVFTDELDVVRRQADSSSDGASTSAVATEGLRMREGLNVVPA